MIENNVFTYWEGVMPPYIEYCLQTIRERAGCNVVVLTPNNLHEYLPKNALHPHWNRIAWIAQKVDCIRLAVLHAHGGVWVDADTVMLRSVAPLLQTSLTYRGLKWRNKKMLNGYFVAKKHSTFLEMALFKLNERLARGNGKSHFYENGGVELGEGVLVETCAHYKGTDYDILPLHTFIPLEFPFDKTCWFRNELVRPYIKQSTVAIALNHSQFDNLFKHMSVKNIQKEKNLRGDIFRFSEQIKKEHFQYVDFRSVSCPT